MPWKINPYTGEMDYYEKKSDPPEGTQKVTNSYVEDGKLVVEYEGE